MKEKGLKCFLSFIVFFLSSVFVSIFIKYVLRINFVKTNLNIAIFDLVVSLLIGILLFFINKDLIKKDLKKKLNINDVVKDALMFFVIKFGLAFITTLIATIFGLMLTESKNQSLVEQYLYAAPIILLFSSTVLAPFNEELVFRGSLKGIFKNKKVFVIVSGLIFGLVHVVGSFLLILELITIGLIIDLSKNKKLSTAFIGLTLLLFGSMYYVSYGNVFLPIKSLGINEIINSISYVGLGIYLGFIYYKRNNIINNMLIHGINNFLSSIMILFLM